MNFDLPFLLTKTQASISHNPKFWDATFSPISLITSFEISYISLRFFLTEDFASIGNFPRNKRNSILMSSRKNLTGYFTQGRIKHSLVGPVKSLQPCKRDLLYRLCIGGNVNNEKKTSNRQSINPVLFHWHILFLSSKSKSDWKTNGLMHERR